MVVNAETVNEDVKPVGHTMTAVNNACRAWADDILMLLCMNDVSAAAVQYRSVPEGRKGLVMYHVCKKGFAQNDRELTSRIGVFVFMTAK